MLSIKQRKAFFWDGDRLWIALINNKVCEHYPVEHNRAIGSGNRFALAAMDFGKTAKEAVEYAACRDVYTGGKVESFRLDELVMNDPVGFKL